MIDELKSFHNELKDLRKDVKSEKVDRISKKSLRERAEELGSRWFEQIYFSLLSGANFSEDLIGKYSSGFERLIKISSPNNLKKSYVETLDDLIKPFRNDLIVPVQSGQHKPSTSGAFDSFFSDIGDNEESDYLHEAISCAKLELYRAAVVLGWCATIDRIHRKIELIGFSTFNVRSAWMASQPKGRFKRFNQTQNVSSISELREVFDTTILWIIEGMGLIDSNQHTRLKSCFDMRCHGAHPGDAPITEYNLMSFFSDLDQIVLSNPNFSVRPNAA